jgi:L-seryl-tRNA(Ser) seleniumtransferase
MPDEHVSDAGAVLRRIPSVDHLLVVEKASPLIQKYGRERTAGAIRTHLEDLRNRIRTAGPDARGFEPEMVPERILGAVDRGLAEAEMPRYRRVVNATGIVLHTGLGRAVLPAAALDAVKQHQKGFSLLSVDRITTKRIHREQAVRDLLCQITGAEHATVVNNNAAATMICLAAFARGKEVVVSRGQMVEIGGSFRIPDVLRASGAKLVEVGTTNRTHIADYERAIGPETAMLVRVHSSNYKIVGFVHEVPIAELCALGKKTGVPVMDDLGSGALLDFAEFGLTAEPTVQESVKAGAGLITFSADKLLGGPQAGIILGRKDLIAGIRKDPLFRAMRVDKLRLSVLEATLKLFLDRDRLVKEHPTVRMAAMTLAETDRKARRLAAGLKEVSGLSARVVQDFSQIGGGSLPGSDIPTKVVHIAFEALSPDEVHLSLRKNSPPIFARVWRGGLVIDPRTLQEGEEHEVVAALKAVMAVPA